MDFTKSLTRAEARHRYLQIHKADRSFFPEQFEIFKMKFGGKIYEMKINNRDCMMTGQLYENYRFSEGEQIRITLDKKGIYTLETV